MWLITSPWEQRSLLSQLFGDIAWKATHIDHVLDAKVVAARSGGHSRPERPRGKEEQSRYKLSYFTMPAEAPPLVEIQSHPAQRNSP